MEDEKIIIKRSEIPAFIGPNSDGYINWDRRMGTMLENYKRKYSEKFINEQSEEWQKRFYIALEEYFESLRMKKRKYKKKKKLEKELLDRNKDK